ncbi:acyl-phosphate glycerol-3-phosphate acyltransferase [Novosphingobium sp. Rr 2-17]|uniref:glycerol-3-phosphate 1-O-acyltransferase PlsY n=1 Tax=Novosphingobium sp. Rr 2-17 TaxID=555793 RepID=UPI0002699816|nr:glycerol-3-phosphate 1-O-acyltransferase PlsY [Novosphingobium sp. Rr 2-17]EIZ80421.1 acyl-phosphate glycerol-3-phosphate acyltransferase [Novosphingobium sp. Rr 2-17]
MNWILAPIAATAVGYLLGSVPFGLILTRLTGAGDLRSIGSGNIGATNVLRTGRKGLAAATLLLDLLKGLAAVLIVARMWPDYAPLAALGALLGHCFPVWLGFRGGKGVATAAGVSFGLGWPIGLAYAVTWIGLLALVRISSVAGMTAAIVAPIVALALGQREAALVLAVIAALVLYLHRENIARLRAGTEPKVGSSKS